MVFWYLLEIFSKWGAVLMWTHAEMPASDGLEISYSHHIMALSKQKDYHYRMVDCPKDSCDSEVKVEPRGDF